MKAKTRDIPVLWDENWIDRPKIEDMPALQAEDDGFLFDVKMSMIDPNLATLDIADCGTIEECALKLLGDSSDAIDRGSTLPFYIPRPVEGDPIYLMDPKVVWSGRHIDIPLCEGSDPELIRELILGGIVAPARPCSEFMEYPPAFRVALICFYISQIVLMQPLRILAFVLGRYEELPFEDKHFKATGLPATELVMIGRNSGPRIEWKSLGNGQYAGAHRPHGRTNGWHIRIRGSEPKESVAVKAWQAIRKELDRDPIKPFTYQGKQYTVPEAAPSGRTRARAGNAQVTLMYEWAKELIEADAFPRRGSFLDWYKALELFKEQYPDLDVKWSPMTMRKAYERRKRKEK